MPRARRVRCSCFAVALIAALLVIGVATPAAALTLEPARLDVRGDRGAHARHAIKVLVRAETAPGIQGLTAANVVDDEGRSELVDFVRIASEPPPKQVDDGLWELMLHVDLGELPSGEWTGTLLLRGGAEPIPMPMRLTVKDRPWLPALLLTLGVVLGMLMNDYNARGRRRDELLVRLSSLPDAATEPQLPKAWVDALTGYAVDAQAAVRREDWDAAEADIVAAEDTWARWRKHRGDWLRLDAYADELAGELADGDDADLYPRALGNAVDDARRGAVTSEDAVAPHRTLSELAAKFNRFEASRQPLAELVRFASRPVENAAWAANAKSIRALRRRLAGIGLGEEAELDAIDAERETLADVQMELLPTESGVEESAATAGAMSFSAGGSVAASLQPLRRLLAPPLLDARGDYDLGAARVRRGWYELATKILAVGTLAAGGFAELYSADPVFGSDPWADYVAIAAWGLFSETGREQFFKSIGIGSSGGAKQG